MAHTITVPNNQLERIENRLISLEKVMKKLLGVIETHQTDQNNIFHQLFTSPKFNKYMKETVDLFHKDSDQFVNPFASYCQK